MKFRLWSNSKFLGLIDFSHFFTKEDFDNQCELFITYNLSVRKMKELLLMKNEGEFIPRSPERK